ncbi:GtrA family protein [Nocardia sp. CA-290969]|uniref:GtrA family protein n=1 Tax=Nocardia sp. CA-290969 TaxID=3239986 RepID=UPI003D8F8983
MTSETTGSPDTAPVQVTDGTRAAPGHREQGHREPDRPPAGTRKPGRIGFDPVPSADTAGHREPGRASDGTRAPGRFGLDPIPSAGVPGHREPDRPPDGTRKPSCLDVDPVPLVDDPRRRTTGPRARRFRLPSGHRDPVVGSDSRTGGCRAAEAPPAGSGFLLRLVRRQEAAFAIVGAVNTVMGIGLTVAWLTVLGDSVPPSAGVAAAYLTGIGIAFVLHRRLVFRVRGRIVRDFLGFAAVNCGGLIANALLLEVAVSLFGFPRAPSAVMVMGAVAAGTFFGHRYISFRRPAV